MALNPLNSSRLRDLRPAEQPKPFSSQHARAGSRKPGRQHAIQSPVRESQVETKDHLDSVSNQVVREGHYEAELVKRQANKEDAEQPMMADVLETYQPSSGAADVCVVGCGPSGLALAAELASNGIKVALVGREQPFVNNYGVWTDEYSALGLEETLNAKWDDAVCYFGEGKEVRVGRSYGRVCRKKFRQRLLENCKAQGVQFLAGEVANISCQEGAAASEVTLVDGRQLKTRLVTLAAGAAAGKFMQFEMGAPTMASQTAYGIEAEVEGYEDTCDPESMLFMDFRRYHSGIGVATAPKLQEGMHPAAGEGLWGTQEEVPSFLYAMPSKDGRMFLEETCLVAKPALPFATLKRRLHRRMAAMGLKVKRVLEEEWSYIPVGGPLPINCQPVTAFGAAANLVHPATGYSIVRSLREAPELARAMAGILKKDLPVAETSIQVWDALWPQEKRRQAAFHVFGMELLATLDLAHTNAFFSTFFRLPDFYWRGFLSSELSSGQLIIFALLTYALAPLSIKWSLMRHLVTSPAGGYLVRAYLGLSNSDSNQNAERGSKSSSSGVYITPAR